jgi:hypothetical protein
VTEGVVEEVEFVSVGSVVAVEFAKLELGTERGERQREREREKRREE